MVQTRLGAFEPVAVISTERLPSPGRAGIVTLQQAPYLSLIVWLQCQIYSGSVHHRAFVTDFKSSTL